MKSLFKHITIFIILPMLIGISPGLYFAAKENLILRSGQKFLYNPSSVEQLVSWKLKGVKNQGFDVIAVGSSRVNQFSEDMFNQDVSFYNLSPVFNNIEDLDKTADLIISSNKPKILLIGIDQWMLNDKYHSTADSFFTTRNFYFYSPQIVFSEYLINMKEFRYEFEDYKLIGIKANKYLSGYKNDGSYFYGKTYYEMCCGDKRLLEDFEFADTKKRISEGNRRFEHGFDYSNYVVNKIDQVLQKLRANNIKVIGFFPPFPPAINKLMNDSGNFKYIQLAKPVISEVFDKYNFKFFDFTENLNFNDDYYIDGFHGNRNVYYEILKRMDDMDILLNPDFDNDFMISNREKKLLTDFFKKQ